MLTLYAVLLFLVGAMMIAMTIAAVASVSRRRGWGDRPRRALQVVETIDRREEQLPYVGRDRRTPEPPKETDRLVA